MGAVEIRNLTASVGWAGVVVVKDVEGSVGVLGVDDVVAVVVNC